MTSLRPSFFSKWAAQRRIARLPEIQLARQANYYMTNTSPNPDWTATIATSAGIRVGTATYAVTPLDDQLWLYGLEIAPAHRRHGYALALLWQLHQAHRLPIHPVHELGTAGGFWHRARRLASAGLQVAEALSLADLEEAKKRNETAECRVIGIAVETRPDSLNDLEINSNEYVYIFADARSKGFSNGIWMFSSR